MKLKVFKSPKAETLSPVYLVLQERDQSVRVRAVNEFGAPIPGGNLLTFSPDGTIIRHVCVADSLGFKLDLNGAIESN